MTSIYCIINTLICDSIWKALLLFSVILISLLVGNDTQCARPCCATSALYATGCTPKLTKLPPLVIAEPGAIRWSERSAASWPVSHYREELPGRIYKLELYENAWCSPSKQKPVHIKSFSLTSAGEKFALDSIRRRSGGTRPERERASECASSGITLQWRANVYKHS